MLKNTDLSVLKNTIIPIEIKIKNPLWDTSRSSATESIPLWAMRPYKVKGTDLGMTPVELVLAGISMCKVTTIWRVARRNNIAIGEVDSELSQAVK